MLVCSTALTYARSVRPPEPQAKIKTLSMPIFSYETGQHCPLVKQEIHNWPVLLISVPLGVQIHLQCVCVCLCVFDIFVSG